MSDEFRVKTFSVILDCLTNEFEDARTAYFLCNFRFSFLGKLTRCNSDEIVEFAKYFHNDVYKEELEDHFPNECVHLRARTIKLRKRMD